jgi:putative transcriptional regulator
MIRIKLKQLLDDKAFREGRRITLNEVSEASGIARATLNRIANNPGYNTTTSNLDALCAYFACTPGELLEHVAVVPKESGKHRNG